MKKRLIAIFTVLLIVAVVVILNSAVFTLQKAEIYFYNEEGNLAQAPSGLSSAALIEDYLGHNIFFLSEKDLIASIEAKAQYSDYYVVGVVRHFPDVVSVHLAARVPVFYLNKGGVGYLLDIKGFVVSSGQSYSSKYINISGNFSSGVTNIEEHSQIVLGKDAQTRYDYIQKSASTVWRLNYDYSEISQIIEGFLFEGDDVTVITKTGAKIVIQKAETDYEKRFIKALGVYSNTSLDVKGSGSVITVDEKGRVTTTK